ncbi:MULTISPECIES: hypothetical protein [Flavobacterium]|uniref:hypothetical protein n=1 Tax=Flavobacterium TaxID=237 RepID=UPI001FCC7ACB|nr:MULTISPECIES: hypothetical protein [Flavobacterium]UOK41417.1 hypothetical protein LZF87_08795 [Flavobacterium enshiense]
MKKITLLLAVFFVSTATTYCQTSDAEMEAMVNLLGVQKKEAMARLVNVTGKDADAFWKIYDEYQKENKKTATQRMKLYEKTALSYSNLTPQRADSLANQYFANRMDQEKKLEVYYKKIKSATNATVAFQFYQAEVYLLTLVRAQIMQQIPTYGEIQGTKK